MILVLPLLPLFTSVLISLMYKGKVHCLLTSIGSALIGLIGIYGLTGWKEEVVVFKFVFSTLSFNINFLSSLFCLIVGFVGLASSIYSASRSPGLWGLYSLFLSSMYLVLLVEDAFWFMFFWEIMTLTSYFLILYGGDSAGKAGFKYFVMTHIGSGCILLSILLVFRKCETLDFSFASLTSASSSLSTLELTVCLALIVAGFAVKSGLLPFHYWLPDTYSCAPASVTALLSGASSKVAVYGLLLFSTRVFPIERLVGFAVASLGALSMMLGGLYAVKQGRARRLLAYSSIENMGVVGVGLGLGGYGSVYALFHLVNHSLLKSAAFFSVGNIEVSSNSGVNRVSGVIGVSRLLSFSMISSAFFLAGFPPSSMFLSKLGVLCETARFKLLLMLYAFFSFISLAALTYRFMEACMGVSSELKKPVPLLSAVSLALVVVSIVLGVFPAPALEVISRVSSWLGG